MENNRYDYSPIIKRKELKWPNGARIALCVYPNIEYFHIDKIIPNEGRPRLPDVTNYSSRDYGARIGIFRMMDVLDKHGIRASALVNADVCVQHPTIIEEGKKRNWEWLGHGITNNLTMADYPLEEQQKIIRQVKDTISVAVGTAPRGWLGPGGEETFDTPDHLAAEGFDYVCDWRCDDQPIPIRVRTGRMIVVPYQQGLSDRTLLLILRLSPRDYLQALCDQFDVLYAEAASTGKVMAIPLHPFIIGLPYRIRYLDKALEYICSHEGVWRTTGGEVADWYYRHYYEDPGRPSS
jgi:allantoinase